MNIGFDAIRLFNNTSGLGNYSRYVLRAMLQFQPQHRYFLYTPRVGPAAEELADTSSVTVQQPSRGMRNVVARNIWRSLILGRTLKRDAIDVYHGLSHELPSDLRMSGVPGVVTMHDLIYLRLPEHFKSVDRLIYDQKFRRSCRDADLIIALSEQTRRDLIEFYGTHSDKIRVVYQGCDQRFYGAQTQAQLDDVQQRYDLPQQYMLQVGSIESRKNALRSVQALAITGCDLPLVVVGRRTAYQAQVLREIERQRLSHRVRILNDVPTSDLPALYRMALFSLYPSLFEGFGLPVLESLAVGTPVIAATGSCLEEAGGQGALYVDPTDIEALADAMVRLAEDGQKREQLSRLGVAHAQTFRPERMAETLNNMYTQLARG